jgi:hypothetical protein
MTEAKTRPHQEWNIRERCLVGRDPRCMTPGELQACGITPQPLLAVIRAKCLDCCCGNAAEVRRCGDISCANWAYRMNVNPFRTKRRLTETQRAALEQARLAVRPRYYPGEIEERAPVVEE